MDRKELVYLAERAKKVLSRAELLSAGVSGATISRRVKDSEWARLLPGVYLVNSGTASFEQIILAVMKWAGDRPVVFHRETAAYLHRLVSDPPATIDIRTPPSSAMRSVERKVRVFRSRTFVESKSSPPRTSLEETAADLIRRSPTQRVALEILIRAIQQRMNVS